MFEVFNPSKSYTLINGREVSGEDLVKDDQYPLVGKTDCFVEILDGVVHSILGCESVCNQYGIESTSDKNADANSINELIKFRNESRAKNVVSASSMLKVAKIIALDLTDEQAVEVSDLYPEFEIGHEYKIGDRFQYNRSLFKVNQAHTSQAQWVPGETGTESLYTNLMLDESGYQIWKQPTGAHDAYNTGDVVRYPDANGQLYKSTINGNVWAPDSYPQGWEVYTEE